MRRVAWSEEGPLDYLTLDYLAEVTMSIMQKARQRDPRAGYATDFVELIRNILPTLRKKKIRVVANAGGVNPDGCRDALIARGARAGRAGTAHRHRDGRRHPAAARRADRRRAFRSSTSTTDGRSPRCATRVLSANVYISSFPGPKRFAGAPTSSSAGGRPTRGSCWRR